MELDQEAWLSALAGGPSDTLDDAERASPRGGRQVRERTVSSRDSTVEGNGGRAELPRQPARLDAAETADRDAGPSGVAQRWLLDPGLPVAAAETAATSAARDAVPARRATPDWEAEDAWQAGTEAGVSPVIEVLRTLADAEARPSGRVAMLGQAMRSLAAGLVDPGAVEALELERELIASVCAPQRHARVVAVMSGQGGAGTTTTAAGIALTLAAMRQDTTVLADARSGTASLTNRLAGRPGPSLRAVADGPRSALPFVGGGGLRSIDGAPSTEPMDPHDLRAAVDGLTTTHTFTMLDVGNDLSPAGEEAVRLADQVVIVTTATDEGLQSAQLALDRISERDRSARVPVVFAVVRVRPHADRRLHSRLGRLTDGSAEGALIPYDRYLSGGGRFDPARIRPATRRAYLALAALVAGAGA
ncbi:MinD/ParA family ATP-binding protein [Dactylosporangium sp. CA-092794]|uniref:MinD/ParA family ATP-binding protein n=1 Tax=Dactylosporangium sp. CA-092794 TaxID=3239929 RepID=UPI003D8EBA9C